MRIKRIFAADMREAIRKVREQHGEDAVVISSRKVEGGVEVISAIDYDEEAVQAAARAQDPRGADIPPLDVPAGPRPGDPDPYAVPDGDDPFGNPGDLAEGSGPEQPGSPASDDTAERARRAALQRLRELRNGVAGNTTPPGGGRRESGPRRPGGQGGLEFAQAVGRHAGETGGPLGLGQPGGREPSEGPVGRFTPTATADQLRAQPSIPDRSPAQRQAAAAAAGGGTSGRRPPGSPRIDLRVGGEDDDQELFSNLSREHQQAEQQRVEKQRAKSGEGRAPAKDRSAHPGGVEPMDFDPERTPHQAEGAQAQRTFGGAGAGGGRSKPSRSKVNLAEEPTIQEMREELRTLRSLFENQLSLMEWSRLGRRHPARASVIKRLSDLGLGPDVARRLADHVRGDEDPDAAYRKALALIARYLPVTHDEIVNQGGVVALVGPTGVGKTTTVAKLAARYALRHGRERVALVSTDNYRIGAQDQLLTYARILDVPVYTAGNRHELRALLDDLLDRGLVLIDTVGMSQRDVRLAEQFKTLGSAEGLVRTYLVLSASTQLSTLTESVRAFSGADPAGCILTKVDEASTLGGALTCALRTRLPLAYLGVGQRVPEDLQAARGDTLVHKACALLEEFSQAPDEEALALALGGGVHVPE